jgi:hypothetical protein
VRINECEAITALEVLERHCFEQCRFASAGFSNDVDMRKAIFVFYAEDAAIIPKVDPCKLNHATCVHLDAWSPHLKMRSRQGILPKTANRTRRPVLCIIPTR